MGKEDQAEEIEILESIYPEELEIVDDDSIAIHLGLETEQPRALRIGITYVDEYPEVAPRLVIQTEDPPEAEVPIEEGERRFTYDFTRADCGHLLSAANEAAQENLGIPMVFTLVSAIKEQAEELYEERIRDQEARRLKELSIEEEKEQAKFRGTPVTKQSFAEWRAKFRHEMGWDKPKERPFGRLTGKEIFERGLDEDDEDEE